MIMIIKLKDVIAAVLGISFAILFINTYFRRASNHHDASHQLESTSIKKSQANDIPAQFLVKKTGDVHIKENKSWTKDGRGEFRSDDEHRDGFERDVPDDIIRMAPDLFKKIPRQFLPQYKNPCWLKDSELNCLPYFYIIGMPKCGTTDLWDKIVAHPDVIDRVPKEPHWWSRRRLGWTEAPIHKKQVKRVREMTGHTDDSSLEWYLNWFKTFGMNKLKSSSTTDENGKKFYTKIFGDGSISTAWDISEDWKRLYPNATEPPYVNADLIHALQPTAKIIMAVRNPTDRDYSMYYYNNGTNPEDHERKTRSRIRCFQKCLSEHTARYCAYQKTCSMQKGLYFYFLSDWIKVYQRSGVLVVRLEDWKAHPLKEYRRILQFLNLDPLSSQEIDEILSRDTANVNKKKTTRLDMLDTTKQALDTFFRPFNKKLGRLLDDDRFTYST